MIVESPYYLAGPLCVTTKGQLTEAQFRLGMVEHHGPERAMWLGCVKYFIRVGHELHVARTLGTARRLARRVVKGTQDDQRRHGVAKRYSRKYATAQAQTRGLERALCGL